MPNKIPAFPLYPKDLFTDKVWIQMDWDQRGQYMQLLGHMWLNSGNQYSIEKDHAYIAKVTSIPRKSLDKLIALLLNGKRAPLKIVGSRYISKKLQKIKREMVKKRRSYSERGKKGAETRWQGDSPATPPPMRKHARSSSASPSSSPTPIPDPEKREEEPATPPPAPVDTGEQVILAAMKTQQVAGNGTTKREYIKTWRARGYTAGHIEQVILQKENAGAHVWDLDKLAFPFKGGGEISRGLVRDVACSRCQRKGLITRTNRVGTGQETVNCPDCGGTGYRRPQ